jgi:ABC-type dipeptide/oligopeptide/nickel transport system permease subunit
MVIGTLIGLLSGYFGGKTGAFLFRFTEWFLVIPFLPLAIVLATILRRSRSGSGRTSSALACWAPGAGTR